MRSGDPVGHQLWPFGEPLAIGITRRAPPDSRGSGEAAHTIEAQSYRSAG
jgi:hypothetical protein